MNKNQKLIIILFFVFLIIFIFSSFLLSLNKEKKSGLNLKNNLEEKTNTSTINFYKSKINLIAEKQVYNLTDSLIKIDVFADVPEEKIGAYDLILNYNQENLEFIKAESVFSEFQVFTNKNNNNLFLTIAKISQDQNPVFFNNEKILSIYFKPKNLGESFVKIEKKLNNYSTKFVNEKTEIIYPEVNQIKINVK